MSGLQLFTLLHVAISFVAIASGCFVVQGLMSNRVHGLTSVFIWTTAATSITGFLFPFNGITPAIGTGIVAIAVLVPTLLALYVYRFRGPWRWVYALGAVFSLYLNVFVLVVQSFLKIPPLHELAQQGSEPPFAMAQGIVLLLFIVLGVQSFRRFHVSTAR